MTPFQQIALLLTVIWLALVTVWFRRSNLVLIGGLVIIGVITLAALLNHNITPDDLGLGLPNPWPTLGFALLWLALMLAYSPIADWLASRWFTKPPTLEAFRTLQQSRAKLVAGIVVAWVLGGVLEELVARGIVLKSVEALLATWHIEPMIATGMAVCSAAIGAGLMHSYQGPRAMAIITQLSILFGVLFIVSGYNLWAVILCHGLYDTIAFVRFANKNSKYSEISRD